MELIDSIAQLAPVANSVLLYGSDNLPNNIGEGQFFPENVFENEQLASDIKRLYAAACKIAQEKGLPGFENMQPLTTAITADMVFTKAQLAYQLANGTLSVDAAAEIIADKSVSVVKTVADRVVTEGNIKNGLDKVVDLVSLCYPSAQSLKAYTAQFAHFITPKIRKVINEGLPMVKTVVKTVVKRAGNYIIEKVSKVKSALFNYITA